jgi:hypothetical protein
MLQQYNNVKGAPSDYLQGGRVAKLLGLTVFPSILWSNHLIKVTQNVLPHAEWMTGKKPPRVSQFLTNVSTTPNEGLQKVKSKLEMRIQSRPK